MVDVRSYIPGDEYGIVQLWNICLENDQIQQKRFRNMVILDENFDPEGLKVAVKEDTIIGALYAVRRQTPFYKNIMNEEDSWITFFFVHPDQRRKGIGTSMFNEAQKFLKKSGVKNLYFSSYTPNYFVPGIDKEAYPIGYEFLRAHEFRKLYSCVAMDKNLVNFKMSESIKKSLLLRRSEGYSFDYVSDKDFYELVTFASNEFNPDWGRAIREAVLKDISYNQIIIVKNKEEKIVGFSMFGGYETIQTRFGPIGIASNEQGNKLGNILLNLSLKEMVKSNLHSSWFLWTGEKSPAGQLYSKLGFKVTREFHVMFQTIS